MNLNQYTVKPAFRPVCGEDAFKLTFWNRNMSRRRLTLLCSRYVRSFTVSGPAGSPLRALQAASRAVSPLGLRPLTWAPPSTSRRTRRSLPEAAALMRGLLSDKGSHMACREHEGQWCDIITFNMIWIFQFYRQNTFYSMLQTLITWSAML